MDDDKPKYNEIKQIGPLFIIEGGDIFLSPFRSFPLNGFKIEDSLINEEPFINSVQAVSTTWFERFPNCCSTHKKLTHFENFNKENYAYIPSQIINNLRYFNHSLEVLLDIENWFNEITDYLDYLIASFGNPQIGGHIFDQALKIMIEGITLEKKEFTDDQRLELLKYLEPTLPPVDQDERRIELLYITFQKWLNAMPNIGKFIEIKARFDGKIPMGIFLNEPRTNKYLGLTKSRTRSRKELLEFLVKLTDDILKASKEEFIKANYNEENLVLAAEERLRLKQDSLLCNDQLKEEITYSVLIEKWLSIVIEYYQVLNQVVAGKENKSISTGLAEIKVSLNDALSLIDEIKIEISTLCKSHTLTKWLSDNLPTKAFNTILNDIDKLVEDDKDNTELLEAILIQLQFDKGTHFKSAEVNRKINDSEISVKHRLKLSVPLFLFIKYEAEIEMSNKQRLPKSFKELKSLLLK